MSCWKDFVWKLLFHTFELCQFKRTQLVQVFQVGILLNPGHHHVDLQFIAYISWASHRFRSVASAKTLGKWNGSGLWPAALKRAFIIFAQSRVDIALGTYNQFVQDVSYRSDSKLWGRCKPISGHRAAICAPERTSFLKLSTTVGRWAVRTCFWTNSELLKWSFDGKLMRQGIGIAITPGRSVFFTPDVEFKLDSVEIQFQ